MICSIDIFDTCLTRKVAEPAEVFDRMAERLGYGGNFGFMRREAEREACRLHGEATLAEIYEILGRWMGWNDRERQAVMGAEMEEEQRQLFPVPEVLAEVNECRKRGETVVFLSDMYLPSDFLLRVLQAQGFFQEGDQIWVSCEHRTAKHDGGLYRAVMSDLGHSDWRHTGNCIRADVLMARQAGLKAVFFGRANLTPHEQRLVDWTREGERSGANWAAAAREARLQLGALTESEHAIAAVSVGVAAPLLLTYVSWLVDRAAALGLERLYFLARDGQILLELFKRVATARGIKIQARYLHASRIALRFPRSFPMTDTEAAGVFQAADMLPLSVVALRLGIPVEQLAGWLPTGCTRKGSIPKSRMAICMEALRSPEACRILNQKACERSSLLEDYLRQEGLMESRCIGLVDLGWAGSLQAGIMRALEDCGHQAQVHGFYLGLNGLPGPHVLAEAFTFDFRKRTPIDVAWFVMTAELFSQADHGTTLGFRRSPSGGIEPVMDEFDGLNPALPNWLTLHQRAVLGFADAVIEREALPTHPGSLVRLLREHLRQFCHYPSRAESEAWGSCHFSSHGSSGTTQPMAPSPRSPKDWLWVLGIRCLGAGSALWPHASAARLPKPLCHAARLVHRLRNRLRPLQW